MNVTQLRSNVGQSLRLNPVPVVVASDGKSRSELNEPWILERVDTSPARLVLRSPQRDLVVEIHSDSVREFRRPDVLALRTQVVVRADRVVLSIYTAALLRLLPLT